MSSWKDDYTRSRTVGVVPYSIEDKIGRRDPGDRARTSLITATSTTQRLPLDPLGGRNFIRVRNDGAVNVAIVTASGMTAASGTEVAANGGTWEDSTNAPLYIVSTGANSDVQVYERASR